MLSWTRRDFTVQYRQSILGLAWAVAQPLLLLAFYGVVFTRVLNVEVPRGSYIVFALCGLAPWTFFASSVSRSVTALSNSAPIIKQVYFPRSVVGVATAGVSAVDLIVSTAILLVAQVATEGTVHMATLALAPLYLAYLVLVAALAVVLAVTGAFVRDIRFTLPLVIQIGFIATPIMYPSSLVPESMRWIVDANPIARVVGVVRAAVIDGRWPSVGFLAAFICVALVTFVAATLYSASVEERLPDLL